MLLTPGTRLGHLVSVQDQGADFWEATVCPQDGPEPSPDAEAQRGQKTQHGTGEGQAQVDRAPGRGPRGRKGTRVESHHQASLPVA